jgi:hypothetical protein
VRQDAEYFSESADAAQRRYEAMRAYFLHEMPAAEVADRFGYSTASAHQMATLLPPPRRRPPRPAGPARPGQGRRGYPEVISSYFRRELVGLRRFAGMERLVRCLVNLLPVPSPVPGPAPAPACTPNLQGRSPTHTGGGSRH